MPPLFRSLFLSSFRSVHLDRKSLYNQMISMLSCFASHSLLCLLGILPRFNTLALRNYLSSSLFIFLYISLIPSNPSPTSIPPPPFIQTGTPSQTHGLLHFPPSSNILPIFPLLPNPLNSPPHPFPFPPHQALTLPDLPRLIFFRLKIITHLSLLSSN